MSRFLSAKYRELLPYVPGEQPRDQVYIKLNTNESPFPPAPAAIQRANAEADKLMLYSDPTCAELTAEACRVLGVESNEVIFTNGSDEILNFAFMTFADEDHPAAFPDITYGFYAVFAALYHIAYEEIPLKADFSIDPGDYVGIGKNIFIANPNAPTGLTLPLCEIERIVASNPGNLVVIDEAYVDFGGETAIPLIKKYDNLLVTRTFSKSRNLAGARLGMGIACPSLIRDLNTIKYSTNPYNVNRMTMAAGVGALQDAEYFRDCVQTICKTRAFTANALRELGFALVDSSANFVFAKSDRIGGLELYQKLREKGILVRHFETPRLRAWNRITIGTQEQMQALLTAIRAILGGTL